jgi:hypothetical protein
MSHRTFPAPWRVDVTEGGHFVVFLEAWVDDQKAPTRHWSRSPDQSSVCWHVYSLQHPPASQRSAKTIPPVANVRTSKAPNISMKKVVSGARCDCCFLAISSSVLIIADLHLVQVSGQVIEREML